MKVSILIFIIVCIIVLFLASDKITITDIIIFLCVSYISNKILAFIGEYIKIKQEQRRLELILEKIEKNYFKCQDIQ